MNNDIEQKIFLGEEKEENRLNLGYYWPPPPQGLYKGLGVNFQGNHYKVKEWRFEKNDAGNEIAIIILEES